MTRPKILLSKEVDRSKFSNIVLKGADVMRNLKKDILFVDLFTASQKKNLEEIDKKELKNESTD